MPRFQGATYFTMKGGLNTEASPLNIPPSDATEAVNIDINIDGSFERRRGMTLFSDPLDPPISNYGDTVDLPTAIQFNPSDNFGNIRKHFVIQFHNDFYIYDYDSPETLKELGLPKQTITATLTLPGEPTDLVSYPDIYKSKTRFLIDQNKLFILNNNIKLSYIEYIADEDLFTFTNVDVEYRKLNIIDKTSEITSIPGSLFGWNTGCLAGSRLWLSGVRGQPNTVYFSQTIVEGTNYERMYQEADPYDALDNVLVDTDGGSIQLTGAEKIVGIAPLGAGVIIFASNGIWSIGGQDGFRPTNYSINKISDVGLIGVDAWCAVEQQLVFFGQTNIYTVLLGTSIDTPEVQVIGDKIVSFYTSIPLYNRQNGKVIYSPDLKKLYFFTNFDKQSWHRKSLEGSHYRHALVLDVRLAAWTKYKLSDDTEGDKLGIADALIINNGIPSIEDVTDNSDFVFDDGIVITSQRQEDINDSLNTDLHYIKRWYVTPLPPSTTIQTYFQVQLGELRGDGCIDFQNDLLYEEDNKSYITIAHQTFNDIAHRKFAPYIIPIFKRMESDIVVDGVDSTPGGCFYRVDWDWSINNNSKKYGELRQAYFPYRFTKSRFDGVDPGITIITSRLKIRGRGEVFRLHFESEDGKDFKMYGWQLMLHAKGRI